MWKEAYTVEYKQQFTAQASKTSIIQITKYEQKNFQGTLRNVSAQEPKAFSNLTQLLMQMDNQQDTLKYPQRGMEPRTFKGEPGLEPVTLPEAENVDGSVLATFKVDLLFRQNASWQGTVTWLEDGSAAQFRSALELMYLMDSVLT